MNFLCARWLACCLWLASAVLAPPLLAQPGTLIGQSGVVEGSARVTGIALLRDSGGLLGIDAVASPENAARFLSAPRIGERVLGYTGDTLWLRLQLVNDGDAATVSLVETGVPRLRDVRFYSRAESGVWQERRSGLDVPVAAREVHSRYPVFQITLAAHEAREYFVRVRSGNAIHLPVKAWSPGDFFYQEQRADFFNALQLGGMFLLAIYGFVLFLGTRDRTYLYFLWLLAGYGFYEISIYQYGHQYLWPDSPDWAMRSPGFFMAFAGAGCVLLVARLLQTRSSMPSVHRVLQVLAALALLLAPLMIFLPYAQTVMPVNFLIPVIVTVTIAATLLALLRGFRPARMLLPAFVFLWATSLMRSGSILGFFPAHWLTDYSQSWSVIVAGLLMTMSLIDRVLVSSQERLLVQRDLLRGQVNAREKLEAEVQSRTGELQEAKEKAERADAAKSRFLAQLSHELRTPLHSVLGNAGLMMGEVRGDDDNRRLLAIQRSGRHLLALIEEVLEFVRGDAGRIELSPRPVWLRELLKGVIEEMLPQSRSSDVSLLLQVGQDVPNGVVLDAMRLRQVLLNLIGNACRHSRGKVVSVQAQLVAAEADTVLIRFEVHDDGEGIDAGEHDALFDPFWQSASADRRSGLGLGLPISRQWVRLMGGDITYENRQAGGSLFWFTIPLTLAHGEIRGEEGATALASGSGMLASGSWRAMPPSATAVAEAPLVRPSSQALARLRLAAGLGLVTDIGSWAMETEAAEPHAKAFVARVRTALARIDLAEIRRLAAE